MPALVNVPERPLKLRPPVISLVVASTTSAPRPVPDATAAGAAGVLSYPPLPPPQETAIPARTADAIKPTKTFRKFIINISSRRILRCRGSLLPRNPRHPCDGGRVNRGSAELFRLESRGFVLQARRGARTRNRALPDAPTESARYLRGCRPRGAPRCGC